MPAALCSLGPGGGGRSLAAGEGLQAQHKGAPAACRALLRAATRLQLIGAGIALGVMLGGCLHPVWVHLPRAAGCEPQNTPQRHAEPPARHQAREQEKPAVHQCPIHPSGLGGPQGGARLLLPPLLHAASSSTLRFHPTSQGRPPWAPIHSGSGTQGPPECHKAPRSCRAQQQGWAGEKP